MLRVIFQASSVTEKTPGASYVLSQCSSLQYDSMAECPIILIEKHHRSIFLYFVLYFSLLKGIVFVIRSLSLSSNNRVPNTFSSRISFKEALCMAVLLFGSSICSRDKSLSKTNGMFCEKPHSYSFSSCFCQKR